ncbi:glycerate kinase [Bacillus sp. 31A1R]|uniref:Glycerate kinase n=1 Tax=Robertmurraya mangrovi TaxID=3098077 RepID=A0ABU5IZL1_9BACI|nr:glycerate kinase [Bacillus sp. 31A1R]MDZ5472593.1 glycerate kinase [Bacillus sp. 31A1R]
MKIVVAPDSYKGSMTSAEVASTIELALKKAIDHVEVLTVPMADGGEGTVEALVKATNGQLIHIMCTGPLGDKVKTVFGQLGKSETVILEVASTSGLTMVPLENRNPFKTTSYGLGELIKSCLDKGFRSFIIGLGGSATNDGGLGLLQALGGKFLDKNGNEVGVFGKDLLNIREVKLDRVDPRIFQSTIIIASDVDNPLCGKNGATHVFGPQKGATEEQILLLDKAMKNYAQLMELELKRNIHETPGAGAAGGLGFALLALGGQLESGANVVAKAVALEEILSDADFLFTGEGRSDVQTLHGKVPSYVGTLAKKHKVKTILLSGSLGENTEELYTVFDACFSITNGPISLDESMVHAKKLLYNQAFNIAQLLKFQENKG